VVPLHNEEANVAPLYAAVVDALQSAGIDFELILVDDGSRDGTSRLAAGLAHGDNRVCLVRLRRNFGQTAAMAVGIRTSRGRLVATMDGDGQNDPTDIPAMVALIEAGSDIVVGWRRKRQDSRLRVIPSKIANWMMRRIMRTSVKDTGCSLKVYRGNLIRNVPLYSDMHRFIPALAGLAGARLAQMQVKHHARMWGHSKYGYSRIGKVFLDLISIRFLLSFSKRPYAWVLGLAVPFSAVGVAAILVGFWHAILWREDDVVLLGVGLLAGSLAVFTVMWGLIGLLIAETSASNLQQFARVAAELSQRDVEE